LILQNCEAALLLNYNICQNKFSMAHLFTPLKIKNTEFKNRIMVSPMCEYSSIDGFANDWHLVHLGGFAVGGAALIITEATAVSPEGRISPGDLGIWKDEHIEKLKQINDFIHQQGSLSAVQLAHAGRKASHNLPWKGGAQIRSNAVEGWKTLGPSALPFLETEESPEAIDKAGIEKVKADFKDAAARALKAGFDVIEIHAAHGYLIHEFYSPLSNQRSDEYGGGFENRIRILLEIIEAVKETWPADKPLFVRISATDWTEGGWTAEESVKLSKVLKGIGVDFIDCSTGGNVASAKIPLKPGYQVAFAEKIRREVEILTGAVGLITSPEQADEIVRTGEADAVLLAREFLRDPHFPLRAAHVLGVDIKWPLQYERAKWH